VLQFITLQPDGTLKRVNFSVLNDAHYIHNQNTPSTDWVITHGLGKIPSCTILDFDMIRVDAVEQHVSNNELHLHFDREFAGMAILN
jgi:hypothetical protein